MKRELPFFNRKSYITAVLQSSAQRCVKRHIKRRGKRERKKERKKTTYDKKSDKIYDRHNLKILLLYLCMSRVFFFLLNISFISLIFVRWILPVFISVAHLNGFNDSRAPAMSVCVRASPLGCLSYIRICISVDSFML